MAEDNSRWGYTVSEENGSALITMRTRHDAVGLVVDLNSNCDGNYTVEAERVTHEGTLATLRAPAGSDKGATA